MDLIENTNKLAESNVHLDFKNYTDGNQRI